MKGLLLIAVFGLALLSFTAITAEHTNVALEGYSWANKICSSAHDLCKYPHEIGYAAVACGVLWLLTLLVKLPFGSSRP
jgi:hypothetical protein